MTYPKEILIPFHQNLGKLFYAIAASDKTVREEEFNVLKALIKRKWLSVFDSENNYKIDATDQIETVFKRLVIEKREANSCYNEFIAFKKEYSYLFTPELNRLILKTSGAIAAAFSSQNKSELIMLAKLSIELKKQTNEK